MLISQIASQVRRIFGDGGGVFLVDQDFIDWTNDAIAQIVRETKCSVTSVSATAPSYVNGLAFPARFVQMIRVTYNNIPLPFVSQEDLDTKYSQMNTVADSPLFYYQNDADQTFRLFPNASAGDTNQVTWVYSVLPADLTLVSQSPSIPERYHSDVLLYCRARAYERNQDSGAYDRAMTEFQTRISTRVSEDVAVDDSYPVIRDDPWEY